VHPHTGNRRLTQRPDLTTGAGQSHGSSQWRMRPGRVASALYIKSFETPAFGVRGVPSFRRAGSVPRLGPFCQLSTCAQKRCGATVSVSLPSARAGPWCRPPPYAPGSSAQ
jgi:hypothetical protein